MSEQNNQVARRFEKAFAEGDIVALKNIVAANVIDHNAPRGARPGIDGLLDAVALFRTGFPDIQISVERTIADDDSVAVFGTITGTNQGPMFGVPATGKRAMFAYMDMFRIVDGVIVEAWHVEDIAGMLGQLGLLPS
jgi:steroid delta-isomerase-like uncharacterized protein